MQVTCPDCLVEFDDLFRSWICPHGEFTPSPDALQALQKRGIIPSPQTEVKMSTPEGEGIIDPDLQAEIQSGSELVTEFLPKFLAHMERMGAGKISFPVQINNGNKYLFEITRVE